MKLEEIKILPKDRPMLIYLKNLYEDTYVLEHDRFGEIGELLESITQIYGQEIVDQIHDSEEISSIINREGGKANV